MERTNRSSSAIRELSRHTHKHVHNVRIRHILEHVHSEVDNERAQLHHSHWRLLVLHDDVASDHATDTGHMLFVSNLAWI